MLKLNKDAEGYLKEFKAELEKFEDVTRKSIPIVQNHLIDDIRHNKIMYEKHKEELRELQIGYWRLVTKLDTVKNLIVLSGEEHESLNKILEQGLRNFVKLLKINDSENEKNGYKGNCEE